MKSAGIIPLNLAFKMANADQWFINWSKSVTQTLPMQVILNLQPPLGPEFQMLSKVAVEWVPPDFMAFFHVW